MGRLFTLLVVVAAGVWLVRRVWPQAAGLFTAPAGLFTISFREGQVTKTDGVIPRTVYDGLSEVATRLQIDGEVKLGADGDRLFSREVPAAAQQQMRNMFIATRTF